MLRTQFSPRNIANLALWLDANNVAGMAQLSDGTTSVTANADPVGYWSDQSGGGYHAKQATNNNRPTYRTNAQNGLSVLRFDGSNDSYQVASLPLDATISVYVAAKFNKTGVGSLFIEHGVNVNNESGFAFYGSNNSVLNVRRTDGSAFWWAPAGTASWAGTSFGVMDMRISAGSAVNTIFSYWLNGTQQTNGTANASTGTVAANRTLTANLFLGSRNQSSLFSDGDFGEIIVYNRDLSNAEQSAVRRYLGRKWGIAIT